MKGHTLMQLEGIGQPVFGNFPRFGQARHDRAIAHKAGKPLKDVQVEHRVDRACGGGCRIKMWRLKLHCDGDVVFG